MNPADVPVPERLKGFPFYKGYLIHFTVYILEDGTPDFRIAHENNRRLCMERDLCALCGKPLERPMVFIGGPKSAAWVTGTRIFLDGPMHEECALYGAKTCPFLVNPDYNQRPLDSSRAKLVKEGSIQMEDENAIPGRPAKMALYYTNSYTLVMEQTIYYRAGYPIKIDWDTIPSRKD